MSTEQDYKVADISLADWGRKRNCDCRDGNAWTYVFT